MYDWPDGWREAVIADIGGQQSKFLMDVLSAWQHSTPLEPYTNNPLGMPFRKGMVTELLGSGYGMFPTMSAFRVTFAAFLKSDPGSKLRQALVGNDKPAPVYRAIHALGWPANKTETDYPSAVLDMTTQAVRDRLQSTAAVDRKSSGIIGHSPAAQGGITLLGRALQDAANSALGAANALRRYNPNG